MGLFSKLTEVLGDDVVSKTNPLLGNLSKGSATRGGADVVSRGADYLLEGAGTGIDAALTTDIYGQSLLAPGGGGVSAIPGVYGGAKDTLSSAHDQIDVVQPYATHDFQTDPLTNWTEAVQPTVITTSPEGTTSPYVDTGLSDTQQDFSESMSDTADFQGYTSNQVLSFIEAMKNEQAPQEQDQTDYAALYKQMIDQGAGYLEPYREAGGSALAQLMEKQGAGGFDPGQFSYSGQPIDRSIESYMQESQELPWQQEQLQKQIDRAGSAQGRWGGGGTMRESMREQQGLISQDYGKRFDRATQERNAAMGAEQNMYNRALQGHGLESNRMAQDFSRLSGVAGMGERAATSTGGMYSGLGSQLLGQQHQQSMFDQQLAEQRRLAAAQEESNMWSGLLGLVGGGAGMFFGGPAGAAAGYQLGSTAGGMVD